MIENVIVLRDVVVRDRECGSSRGYGIVRDRECVAHGPMLVRDRECGSPRGYGSL